MLRPACLLFACLLASAALPAFETLDRGALALRTDADSVYLGWRVLPDDLAGTVYNLYRSDDGGEPRLITETPMRNGSNFLDTNAPAGVDYVWTVKAVALPRGRAPRETGELARIELGADAPVRNYHAIPLQGDYGFQRVGIADLNGDGRYDYVIKQPDRGLDPGSARPSPGTYTVEAYLHDGSFLWRKDLGWNMNMGIWWTPMIVYDLDGDGKAEVALKTAPYAGSYEASLSEKEGPAHGFVVSGPEYATVLDGMTGQPKAQVDWVERGDPEDWGDNRGNRVNRNQIGIAYLDGERASLLVCRGTYTRMVVDAYDLTPNGLVKRWRWDGDQEPVPVRGQGSHGLHAADLDQDGFDEIILGSVALDHDGSVLWNTGMGHNDVGYLADFVPNRPGLELALGYENRQDRNGICLVDASNGEIIWGHPYKTSHIHDQGMVGDFVPSNPGMEIYAGEQNQTGYWLYDAATGYLLADRNIGGLSPRAVYWTDALHKSFIPEIPWRDRDGRQTNRILDFPDREIETVEGSIVAIADVLGDWREELIVSFPGELRIYSTTIPTSRQRVTLMADPLYRKDAAQQAMGYFYPPQLSYFFR